MPTLFEIEQARQQRRSEQTQQRSAIIGTIVQMLGKAAGATTSVFATAIGAIGGTVIGLSRFFESKEQTKLREKINEKRKFVTSNVDAVLDILYQTGVDLIDKGFNPLSGDFEQVLYTSLYPKIGYLGNCNISLWLPGPSPDPNLPTYTAASPQQIWFTIKDGSLISTSLLMDPPPNIETYWTVKCRNIHSLWITLYQDKLIASGRTAEANALTISTAVNRLAWQAIFGIMVSILIVMVFFRSARIK